MVQGQSGSARDVDVMADYVARLLSDWDGGDRILNVVWDNGNGAAGDALQRLVRSLPGQHTVLNGEIDGRFPAHHPDPTVARNLVQLIDEVHAPAAPTSASRSTATPTASARWTTRATSSPATSCW